MSKWDDVFQHHEVHKSLGRVRDALKKLHGPSLDSAEMHERFLVTEEFVTRKLSTVDPLLVTAGQLDTVNAIASACATDLEAHLADNSAGHWTAATARIDALIQTAVPLPVVMSKNDVDGIRESVIRFRRSAGQLISKLQKNVLEVEGNVGKLATTAEDQVATLTSHAEAVDEKLEEFNKSFEEAEESRQEAFVESKGKVEAALRTAVETATASLKSELDELSEQFTIATDEKLGEFQAILDGATSKLNKTLRDAGDDSSARINELARLTESARESVGIIASTGMAGGYEKAANEEKEAADTWRSVATGAFLGVIIIALLLAFWPHITDKPLTWQTFAAKAYASLACGLLAGYAGREAEKHRISERHHRQRSLELRSLNPYLEPLNAEQQSAVRAIVADRIFGREYPQAEPVPGADGPAIVPSIIDVLKLFIPKH